MTYLVASLAALLIGPLLASIGGERKRGVALLDGFVVVAVPGLVALFFVGEALEWSVLYPLLALAGGFLLPLLFDHSGHVEDHARLDFWALVMGVVGIGVHAALDGAALPHLHSHGGLPLGAAIVLHRLPVGLAIWWLLDVRLGRRWALAGIAGIMAATVVGYAFGGSLVSEPGPALFLFQAFVGGSLIHVAFHPVRPRSESSELGARRAEGFGAVLASGILIATVLVESGEGHGGAMEVLERFWVLAAESAPALLLAYPAAGLLGAFLPNSSIRWMSRGGSFSAAGKGMTVGLPFPVCSCGVVPLYQALIKRGAPPAAAMAFLVATPELGIDAVLLSIPLLGPELTVIRVVTAAAAALLTGWIVGRVVRAHEVPESDESETAPPSLSDRMRQAAHTGLVEVVDHTAPWIIAGLGVAAIASPLFEGGWLASIPSGADVLLFSVIGFPIYVCASSATPVVATLVATGLSPGAAVAFLITGPATNATTLGVLKNLHGGRVSIGFAATLITLAISAGLAINAFFDSVSVPTLAQLTEEAPGLLHQAALALLAVLFTTSLVRRGARRFFGELKAGGGHSHHHGCDT